MCTAATYKTKNHYFGRNLDLYYHYNEVVTVTPRNFPFVFRQMKAMNSHYAMIGMATIVDNYPLYYDATNEHGLSMAGLNFPGIAVYQDNKPDMDNISPFEFIPWILGQYRTVAEVKQALTRINLVKISFREDLPLSPLHWMISDRDTSITVEPMANGLRVFDNPIGILTNNPPFDYHMYHLADYMNLSKHPAECRFADSVEWKPYSIGMGAMGLPGDLSSASRFVKAAFTKLNSFSGEGEKESVTQFFHILGSVMQQRGCVRVHDDQYEFTLYSSCCNTDQGIYYYTTYENSQITAVNMHRTDLNASVLTSYPLITEQQICMQN